MPTDRSTNLAQPSPVPAWPTWRDSDACRVRLAFSLSPNPVRMNPGERGRKPPDEATQSHGWRTGGSRPPLAGTICYLVSLPARLSMEFSVASGTIPAADSSRQRPSRLRTWSMKIARVLLLVFLGLQLVLFSFQDRMIFPGASTQGNSAATVRPRPGTELVRLVTKDGEKVTALFGPALTTAGRPDPQASHRPALIYFYGNGMCLAYAELEFERFRRLGLNVIIPDYVGYGMSEGRPSEKGCEATADAVYDYLVSTRGFEPERIISGGWSMGGAVAIDLASRRKVAGLIAFSTFTSGVDMARRLLPFVPVSLLLRHRFDSEPQDRCNQLPDLDRPWPSGSSRTLPDGREIGQSGRRPGHHALDRPRRPRHHRPADG